MKRKPITKDAHIHIRVTVKMLDDWKSAAKATKLTLTDYIIKAVNEEIER